MSLKIELTDLSGRIVTALQDNFNVGKNFLTIETTNLNTGLYLVHIQSSEGTKTLKMNIIK
jgi:ACT domain-containing protein